MDLLDIKYKHHAKTIIGVCIMPGRKGVDCDIDKDLHCKTCGWCYEVEAKRKEEIRRKMENCS